jgi:hypothetical protein
MASQCLREECIICHIHDKGVVFYNDKCYTYTSATYQGLTLGRACTPTTTTPPLTTTAKAVINILHSTICIYIYITILVVVLILYNEYNNIRSRINSSNHKRSSWAPARFKRTEEQEEVRRRRTKH